LFWMFLASWLSGSWSMRMCFLRWTYKRGA
jgi:hypothetical protein